jgi:hypothetical protein
MEQSEMAESKCGNSHGEHRCEKAPGHRGWHLKVDRGVPYEWIAKANYKPEKVDW